MKIFTILKKNLFELISPYIPFSAELFKFNRIQVKQILNINPDIIIGDETLLPLLKEESNFLESFNLLERVILIYPYSNYSDLLKIQKENKVITINLENIASDLENYIEKIATTIRKGQFFSQASSKFIGNSLSVQHIFNLVDLYSSCSEPIVLSGETGTGKELIAQIIHQNSKRNGKFIAVNCAFANVDRVDLDIFGSRVGAFTGAVNYTGKIEQAHGGTLFLDEISHMPLEVQGKLLRVIENKEVTPLGSNRVKKVNIRIICATSVSLKELVSIGLFMKDLYYRLMVLLIDIPNLESRKQDIPLLIDFFLKSKPLFKTLDPKALIKILDHYYEGNIRELKNIIDRAYILSKNEQSILEKHIFFD